MSELNFSDAPVGEPLEIAEPPVDENVDLDAQDLLAAEEEATHELDGFQVEEATEVTREEAEDLSEKTEASDDPTAPSARNCESSLVSGMSFTPMPVMSAG